MRNLNIKHPAHNQRCFSCTKSERDVERHDKAHDIVGFTNTEYVNGGVLWWSRGGMLNLFWLEMVFTVLIIDLEIRRLHLLKHLFRCIEFIEFVGAVGAVVI